MKKNYHNIMLSSDEIGLLQEQLIKCIRWEGVDKLIQNIHDQKEGEHDLHFHNRGDIVVEDFLNDTKSVSIGVYVDDKFTGGFWDSHEQMNYWVINDINITDNLNGLDCDFDEDDFSNVFKLCVGITHSTSGSSLYDNIMKMFNEKYINDEGEIRNKPNE